MTLMNKQSLSADTVAPGHVTQFDDLLLPGSHTRAATEASNVGRQVFIEADGSVRTAMTWAGAAPMLRVWRDRELVTEHHLPGRPGAPCVLTGDDGGELWLTIDSAVHVCRAPEYLPVPVAGESGTAALLGELLDAHRDEAGTTWLLLCAGGPTDVYAVARDGQVHHAAGVGSSVTGCMDFDVDGRLHLVKQEGHAIEYQCHTVAAGMKLKRIASETASLPFASKPAIAVHGQRVVIAYLGESCRRDGDKRWNVSWQRTGRGGYIAALDRPVDAFGQPWRRHRIADSAQIVMRRRPIGECYGGGPHDPLLIRIEEFSAPSLVIGADGVLQAMWANVDRRWIYASRMLGDSFSPAAEQRGPLELLTGPCLTPRHVPAKRGDIPFVAVTGHRAYLDALALSPCEVSVGRSIDFLQLDDFAAMRGLETSAEQMRKRAENPVIAKGEPGECDDAGLVADITREGGRWVAEYMARSRNSTSREFAPVGLAESNDGIQWTKHEPKPLSSRYTVDGSGDHRYSLRYLRDDSESDPTRRYKGFCRVSDLGPWAWDVVVSPDGVNFTRLNMRDVVRADDDLRLWIDEQEQPARRWKATAIGRSHCGRVAAMWWSADGIHWKGVRDTLDVDDPFGSPAEPGGTGRIVVDAWAGPDDEDELHGGYIFREGERYLIHYMKWTADGHIYTALASSRDGMNFTRVAGGATTLPLGAPGEWDAGRIAIREAPFLVGDTWRQYYTGCGWKHGLGGIGAKTSPFGVDCPNQMGAAEIERGRWVAMRLTRDAVDGELTTIPLSLTVPHRLELNIAGITQPGSAVRCEVLDAATGKAIDGYGADVCDAIATDGLGVPVTWQGRGLNALANRAIRLRVVMHGAYLKLHGVTLVAAQ